MKGASLPFPLVDVFLKASAKEHPSNKTPVVAGSSFGRQGGHSSDGFQQVLGLFLYCFGVVSVSFRGGEASS